MSRRRRLADHLAAVDAARFVGRATVLDRVDQLLAGATSRRVMLVHGPGGIGKSALLREISRRAVTRHQRQVWAVDGRALEPVPGELERALAEAIDHAGAVVLVDSFERLAAHDSLLRERILPGLAADAVVVVAGRQAPSPSWFRGGWEHVSTEVPLGPLPPGEARALLEGLGVASPDLTGPLVDWAGGSPLALHLAASTADPGQVADLSGVDLNRMILRRLAGEELGDIDGEVIEVAAVARAVDARLLATVLPGKPATAANKALRRSSVAEPVGARVTLHDLVRNVVRDDLRRRDPGRYGRLRCRIADHLYARAAAGESRLLSDLVELVDDPAVRWGLGADVVGTYRIDPWRPDEVDQLVDEDVARMGDHRWWDDLAPLLTSAPETGLVARDVDGVPLAFCVATPAEPAPAAAHDDPVLAPALAHAHARPGDRAMIFRESFGVSGTAGQTAVGVLHLSAMLRSGQPNVERSYILDTVVDDGSRAFFQAVGAVHHPQLDTDVDGHHVECWIVDHGPGGVLGQVRDVIYTETGSAAPDPGQQHDDELHRAALDALRDLNRPDTLAANPLLSHAPSPRPSSETGASGHDRGVSREPRVTWLRATLTGAVAATFGEGATDRLLRRVVELGDLDPTTSHDQAMQQLAISRATYYRYLRQARRRVATTLTERFRSASGHGR